MTNKPPEVFFHEKIPTPVGEAVVLTDRQGALRVFDWIDHEDRMLRLLRRQYRIAPVLQAGAAPRAVHEAFSAYFAGETGALAAVRWATGGTAFQRKVWTALCDIPPGQTETYGGLAARIGAPRAIRAVGLANGANPVGLVAPCHRVIGANGTLTGYGGGLHRKRWLLAHEGAAFRDMAAA